MKHPINSDDDAGNSMLLLLTGGQLGRRDFNAETNNAAHARHTKGQANE